MDVFNGKTIIESDIKKSIKTKFDDNYYVSLTTSPERIKYIREMINSIQTQTIQPYRIILNLPHIFKRTGEKFGDLPDFVKDKKFLINFTEDIGPATKILPSTDVVDSLNSKENDPIIISVDDDHYYPEDAMEIMLAYHLHFPECAITASSFDIRTDLFNLFGQQKLPYTITDILEGHAGVLYRRSFLEGWKQYFDFENMSKSCFRGDDFTLSNFLRSKGIYIIRIPYNLLKKRYKTLEYGTQKDALHILGDHDENYQQCASEYEKENALYIERYKAENNRWKIFLAGGILIIAIIIIIALNKKLFKRYI